MISREEAVGILSNQAQNAANILAVIPKSAEEKAQALMNEIEALDMAIEALSQPERPKGRWELIHDDWNVYQCTECKEWWTLECATPQENNMNFCPFCGADMREIENE